MLRIQGWMRMCVCRLSSQMVSSDTWIPVPAAHVRAQGTVQGFSAQGYECVCLGEHSSSP